MEIESYNRQELLNLPVRDWKMTSKYKQILIVPTEELHESGYRLMAVIGIENGKPKEIAAFCDDIEWTVPYTEYPVIRTDMFPNNIIRFHSNHGRFVVGESLSSTDIEFELK